MKLYQKTLILSILLMLLSVTNYRLKPDICYGRESIQKTLAQKFQKAIDNQVELLKVPGIQASVRVGDRYWFSSSGSLDFKGKAPLTTEHILRIGSVTKVFTAGLIMKLYEIGKIDLDEKIDKWFPEVPKSDEINIRQLLNHTSGLYNYTDSIWIGVQTVLKANKKWDPNILVNMAFDKEFYFTPGTQHHYSNTNYVILGLIIEKVTDESLAKIYRDYIFNKYNLENTYFVPYEITPVNLITGYDRDILPLGIHKIGPQNISYATLAYSAGAIISTADDLRQWIDCLFNSDFLNPTTLQKMTNFLKVKDPDIPNQTGYGLGLRRLQIDGDVLYGHTGTIPGFGAAAFYCPQKDYSIGVISNLSMFNQISVLEELVSVINSIK